MILFYDKRDGRIFASISGRVHDESTLKMYVDHGLGEENIGKYIIGWLDGKDGRIESNLDKFDLLQRFEDITPESPLDYKIDIETGNLIKLDKNL